MSQKLRQLYLFSGDLTLVEEACESIIHEHIGSEKDEHNYVRMYADSEANPIQELNSFSMFASVKVVLYSHFELCSKDMLQRLTMYAESPNPAAVLIVAGEKFPFPLRGKTSPMVLFKNTMLQNGEVQKFNIKDIQLNKYISKRVNESGGKIDSQAVRRLSQFVGQDLAALNLEIQKLICFAGPNKSITLEDVERVGIFGAEEKVWNFTRALVQQNSNDALSALYRMLDQGEAAHRILGSITWELRKLTELQDAIIRGEPVPASWKRSYPSALSEAKKLVSTKPTNIPRILQSLVDTNRLFNSSKAGDRRHLESLVLKLCSR